MQNSLLAFLDDRYEDLEHWHPKPRPEQAGSLTRLAAPGLEDLTGKHGYPAQPDVTINDAHSS